MKEARMKNEAQNSGTMIVKASGEKEVFDIEKLKTSLRNAGANVEMISAIAEDIQSWVYDGLTTRKIYSRAYSLFKRMNKTGASLYKLKNAIMEMGPSGHPFEIFVGEIFRSRGYAVQTALVLDGASITHEMDVLASKGKEQILAECKFSVKQGNSVSIQVPLYVHSRVADIEEKMRMDIKHKDTIFETWIVTNSRFTPDSIRYSACKGIHLMGWDFPKNEGLKDAIEREKIFPITVLSTLNKTEKSALLAKGIVTCGQLLTDPGILDDLDIVKKKQKATRKELAELMGTSR